MSSTGSWSLALPNDLPRWTIPIIMLSTLALEVYDVWPESERPIPDHSIKIMDCFDVCDAQLTYMESWEPERCTCEPMETEPNENRNLDHKRNPTLP